MSTTYIPGTCNLGKSEVRRRQLVALIGLVLSMSSGAGLVAALVLSSDGVAFYSKVHGSLAMSVG